MCPGGQVGAGAGLISAGGVVGLFALGALTACAILALDSVVTAWLAALIVGAIYVIVAGALVMVGRKRLRTATPLAPEESSHSMKEDIQWAKTRAKSARQ